MKKLLNDVMNYWSYILRDEEAMDIYLALNRR